MPILFKDASYLGWCFDWYPCNSRIASSMDSSDAWLKPSRASTALESARSHACSTLYELSGREMKMIRGNHPVRSASCIKPCSAASEKSRQIAINSIALFRYALPSFSILRRKLNRSKLPIEPTVEDILMDKAKWGDRQGELRAVCFM